MDQFSLLTQILGGVVRVPRQVLDREEDPDGPSTRLSEIGHSERYWLKRSRDADGMTKFSRLRAIRQRNDIEMIDLSDEEIVSYGEIRSKSFAKRLGLAATLGAGEAAVIAIAESRIWEAIIDERAAREALNHRDPTISFATTRDLLRRAAALGLRDSTEVALIYDDMLAADYRGPPNLW